MIQEKEKEELTSRHAMLSVEEYRSYKYRYVIVTIFCLLKICTGMMGPTFASTQQVVKKIYGVDNFDMNLTTLVFFLAFLPFVFLASWILDKYGLKTGVLFGSGLMTVGAWLRLLVKVGDSKSYFYMIVLGQAVAAVGQPVLVSAPSKLAAYWFPANERVFATTLGSASFELGVIFSYALPLLFISEKDKTNGEGKDHVFYYLVVQSVIITIPTILAFLFFRNRPPSPPSPAAVISRPTMARSIPVLLRNCNYLVLAASFSFFWAATLVIGVVLSQITDKFGFKSTDNSIFGAAFIFFGVAGAIFYAKIIDKTKSFKRALSIFIILCVVFQEGSSWLFYTRSITPVLIMIAILGFHSVPCLPLYLEFACQIAYPVGQDSVVAFIMLPVNCYSTGLTYLCTYLVEEFEQGFAVPQALAGSVLLSLFLMWFVKQDLRRKRAEKLIEQQSLSEDNFRQVYFSDSDK